MRQVHHLCKEGDNIATEMKRFTISITEDMEKEMDKLKQAKYYNTTRNKMIQDLIILGLKVSNQVEMPMNPQDNNS